MDAKEEIKEKLRLEDVVGEYVELKRAGRNFKALSPWTHEKTASLMISPDKQIWHDFSSNRGGDMLSFVMEMEGIDFREALQLLARKAGVELTQFAGSGQAAKKKDRLYQATELAVKYYQACLVKNSSALEYVVKRRGYGKEIISKFGLGYSPSTGQALTNFLRKRKFSEKELEEAGLAVRRSGQLVDMFRGRLMVPLHDGQGRAIGFTARVLDDSLPKYINTAQTMIYDKSRHVFGLHLAKDGIRANKFSVVVEGNLDVIASHKTQVTNVVATAGTALTKYQLDQLGRLSEDVRLAFDQDAAGVAATERAIPIAQEVGVRLSMINISGGKDPDELISSSPKAWEQAVQKSVYVIDWLIEHHTKQNDLSSAEGKKNLSDAVLATVSRLEDPVEQEHYVHKLAELLEVGVDTVALKLDRLTNKSTAKKRSNKVTKAEKTNHTTTVYQDRLLGLALAYPEVRSSLAKSQPEYFDGSDRKKLFEYLVQNQRQHVTEATEGLQEVADYVKLLLFTTEELYEDWTAADRTIETIGLIRRLTDINTKKHQQELSAQIRAAEARGDDATVQQLLESFKTLIKE